MRGKIISLFVLTTVLMLSFMISVSVHAVEFTDNLIPVLTSNTAPAGVASADTVYGGYLPYKAFDHSNASGNGWDSNNTTTGRLAYDFGSPRKIVKYTLQCIDSAQGPSEAPKNWTFEGWNGSNWVTLDTRTNITGWTTGQKREFTFTNTNSYNQYRINVSLNNGSTSHVSIGEMEMMGEYVVVPEPPANLSVWAIGTQVNLSWDVNSNASGYNVKRATGPNGPYTTIADLGGITSTKYIDTIPATEGITYYYVVSAKNPVGESINSKTIPILYNTKNLVPLMTSNTAPVGIASADTVYGGYLPYKAFDQSIASGNGWDSNNTTTGWFAYDFGSPRKIVKYTLVCLNSSYGPSEAPKNWTFEGWTGSNWVVLDTRTNITTWVVGQKREFTFTNTNSYNQYRINVSLNNGATSHVSIGEMEIMGEYVVVPKPPTNLSGWAISNQVNLYWDINSDATGYKLKRATNPNGPYTTIVDLDGVTSTKYIDTIPATEDITYYYVVSAKNPLGESINSKPIPVFYNTKNLVPLMTSNTAPVGVASADTVYSGYLPYKAFDHSNASGNGWDSDNTTTGRLAYDFGSPRKIVKYTLVCLNSSYGPSEAPKNWTFEGWNGSSWVILDTRTNITSWTTGQKREFTFTNSNAYNQYRINVSLNNGSTSHVSIGEMEMMGEYVVAPDKPTNLSGWVISTQVNLSWDINSDASGYNLKRATNPDGPYTIIADLNSVASTSYTDTIPATEDIPYYYVVSAKNPLGESMDSKPIPILYNTKNLVPLMTSNTAPAGVASADTVYGGYLPYKAFDRSTASDNGWDSSNTTTGWIAYDFGSPRKIVKYTLSCINSAQGPSESPKNWTFEGWNGSSWVVLDTRANITGWAVGKKREFTFVNANAYNRYRINVSLNNGSSSHVSIGEMEMMDGDVPTVNRSPVLIPIGNKTIDENKLLEFTINATDSDGDVLSYSANNLPDGAVLDSSTGTFSWTPRSDQAGEYHIQFTVSDGQAAYSEEIVIKVKYIISINFQPQTAEIPSGYIPDSGDLYNARNGYTYGWNKTHTANTRERNKNEDQRLDTECLMLSGAKWEIALENGTYDVTVCVGDAGYASMPKINVEGVAWWTGANLAANQFLTLTKSINVTDGKLTIDNGNATSNATAMDYVVLEKKTVALPVPANLTATEAETSITLSWNRVAGASGYDVEVDGAIINNGSATTYTHTGLVPNTLHTYRVRAVNGTQVSEWSNSVADSTLLKPLNAKINFQPSSSEIPTDYIADAGELYGARNGYTYGWNKLHTSYTRERNLNQDQRLDTECLLLSGAVWEMAIPNGTYDMTVCVGDAGYATTPTINVEGVNYWTAASVGANQFLTLTNTITVTDGKLTINDGSAASLKTSLNYIEIAEKVPLLPPPADIGTGVTADSVILTWDAVTGATSYEVEADGTVIGGTTGTTYVHTGLTPNTQHKYRVRALNVRQPGEWSGEVDAVTLTGAEFTARINFQPSLSEIPTGYIPDGGDLYGARNGYTYGWNKSHVSYTRERNKNADQRLDTECLILSGSKWEIAVPNGTYDVTVCAGDAGYATTATINVEGVNYWTGAALAVNQFARLTQTVVVTDGKLTIDNGTAANLATAINYVDIVQKILPVGIPTNINTVAEDTDIMLNWDPVPESTSYDVEADGAVASNLTGTSYIHSGLEPNTQHVYRVRAVNAKGAGEWSEQVTNSTLPGTEFRAKINFQPTTSEIPTGYIIDSGDPYDAKNGYIYGWNKSQTANMRERNKNSDQRLDTECLVLSGSKWELAVPNGTYDVTVCVGDAGYAATATINVEGINYWTAAALAANQFAKLTHTVTVTDGKLTIDNGSAASLATAIDYMEIMQKIVPPSLSSLAINNGVLEPAFSRDITTYHVNVGYDIANITITPAVEDGNASITVNGVAVISGQASEPIDLDVGDNIIKVEVNAVDGLTKTAYTLTVTREQSAPV